MLAMLAKLIDAENEIRDHRVLLNITKHDRASPHIVRNIVSRRWRILKAIANLLYKAQTRIRRINCQPRSYQHKRDCQKMKQTDSAAEISKPGGFARIRGWFFTGLLVTAPVLLTVYITWAAIKLIDSQVSNLLPGFETSILGNVPGVGLVTGAVLITFIGAIAAGFLGRYIIRLGEGLLNRMPVVRSIYGATKQILETVISTQSDAFREVVLVEYPRKELWVIGFVTGNTKGEVASRIPKTMVNVFVPTTPNPTSGFLLFCPRKDVIFLKMTVEEAVKLVVSGGIVTPPDRSVTTSPAKAVASKKTTTQRAATKKAAAKKAVAKKAVNKKAAPKKAASKK